VSRFIRSALFPILIVIIVAMFIEWVISGNKASNSTPKAIYAAPFVTSQTALQSDLQNGAVKAVIFNTGDPSTAKVTDTSGQQYYVTGITDAALQPPTVKTDNPLVKVSTGTVAAPAAKDVQASFTKDVVNGKVEQVVLNVKDQTMEVTLKPDSAGKRAQYSVAYTDPAATTAFLDQYNVPYDATSPKSPWWSSALFTILPILLIIGFWFFIMNQMQGGGSKVMSFGKSKAKRVSVDSPKVTFKDVAGCDEAVEELHEIKEFLENPKKFQQLGARIPKGVLLYGPPGTGKTLLARAVAGEAGVPFFSISGSDFVEMFVGVGASRVRDLFEQAKQNAPCIIFVDEIDAVGRHRGAGMGGGHDEREQTLNQLLVEMDGFEMKDNIILIAATNRPDILDPALLRPGRFDRQIVVDRPDRPGRKMILDVHSRGKPLDKDIDLDALAAQTPGFTGADLANLVNEAALLAARHGKKLITMTELEEGIMRVLAGPEKKTRIISEKEKAITAYHEMGHALVGHFLEFTDPVHKISVVSRGQALGYTISLPSEDKFLTTKQELMDTLSMTLGGRAAEEVVFGEITTGAANDLEKATSTAKQMIMRYGMSEELGPRTLGHDQSMPFLGREFQQQADYSEEIAKQIDDEIRRIIEEAHQRAKDLLAEKRETLDRVSKILMIRETIDATEFQALVDGMPEDEVFRERDEKEAARRQGLPPEAEKRQRAKQPPVPKPAHVNPVNPEAT
jgi:cell division protease FtsH